MKLIKRIDWMSTQEQPRIEPVKRREGVEVEKREALTFECLDDMRRRIKALCMDVDKFWHVPLAV